MTQQAVNYWWKEATKLRKENKQLTDDMKILHDALLEIAEDGEPHEVIASQALDKIKSQ